MWIVINWVKCPALLCAEHVFASYVANTTSFHSVYDKYYFTWRFKSLSHLLDSDMVQRAPCRDVCHDYEHEKMLKETLKNEGMHEKQKYIDAGKDAPSKVPIYIQYTCTYIYNIHVQVHTFHMWNELPQHVETKKQYICQFIKISTEFIWRILQFPVIPIRISLLLSLLFVSLIFLYFIFHQNSKLAVKQSNLHNNCSHWACIHPSSTNSL